MLARARKLTTVERNEKEVGEGNAALLSCLALPRRVQHPAVGRTVTLLDRESLQGKASPRKGLCTHHAGGQDCEGAEANNYLSRQKGSI